MAKALIVDDKAENLYFLEVLLRGHGFQTQTASNGVQALELARENPPDIIIADILMPVMDGFTLCRHWKQDPNLREIPFVFYTATYTDAKDEALALSLGADRFIIKPMEPAPFMEIIREVINAFSTGKIHKPPDANPPDNVYLKEYNEALIRKLEQKMSQLEDTNRLLAESESRFRRLAENSPALIYRMSLPGGAITYINPIAEKITGYSPEEFYQRPDLFRDTVIPRNHSQELKKYWTELCASSPPFDVEYPIRHKNGQIVWVHLRSVLILDERDQSLAVEGIITDITKRKRAEENVQQQIIRLNALHGIDIAISGSFDLRITLMVLLDHVLNLLRVHAADVRLFDPDAQFLDYFIGLGSEPDAFKALGEQLAILVSTRRAMVTCNTLPELIREIIDDPIELRRVLHAFEVEGFVSYYGMPLIAKGQVKGVLEIFNRKPLNPDQDWLDFFTTLAGQAAIAIDNAELFAGLQRSTMEVIQAYDMTLEGWSRALDLRDNETEGHTKRVADMTVDLARRLTIPEEEIIHLRRGALLHDIGKIGIPDTILWKPGPLNEEEWSTMRKHPLYAYNLISPIPFLKPALDIPYCHHEKWDGSGYPCGIRGEEIPLAARLFAVVDVWDALTSDRPYRTAWSREDTLAYILDQSGKHFDPDIVPVFVEMIKTKSC